MSEALFHCENYFHIGAYAECVDAARACADADGVDAVRRDAFVARSRVAMGEGEIVARETAEDAPAALRAVKLLALYETNEDEKARQSAMEAIGEMLADEHASGDATTRLVGATLLAREGNYVEAMRLCHGGSSLELNAMMVNLLCKMDRAELAEKQAKMMQQIDDDSTIAQLACAWANCASGGKKIQDASYIYQELGDKYKWTPKLYNGSAVCSMMMNSYEDAERDLLEAVAIDPKDGETLANLAACALHLGKSSARFVNAMKQAGVANEALTKIASLERDFDRAAAAVVL
ncbi:predicted protein [Ostreococcus lucimarinus CCE9901]|uniref:Coatomer subunit epsilon n=2 Tax=Ostreococcus sp. 'lucimarinus' TaxID=242159 RepID=A4RU53_OSTLU|nr:predicted protein [Ostreococcus lucimarinus CCE9901]ABO95191.1 predicted protein [Ostreococcus lucimarinus CCE9901]|eukprot:XP_001416898.1 predicted protein [Ostreococcus lucimarinus CCE9901]